MYSYHITFEDGSNPYYHFPTTYSRHYNSIRRWKKDYVLIQTMRFKVRGGGYTVCYRAISRKGV